MPVQTAKSSFLAKVGAKAKAAHKEHAGDETVYGSSGDLPGGIKGGVAELRMCRIQQVAEGKQHAGDWIYFARAIVVKPKEFKGQVVEGMATQVIEPLYDTPEKTGEKARKTFAQHYAFMLNELRMMGINTAEMSETQVEATCKGLEESDPRLLIKFSTTEGARTVVEKEGTKWVLFKIDSRGKKTKVPGKSYPSEAAALAANKYANQEAMVFHNWHGLYTGGVEATNGAVVDESGGDDETEEEMVEEGETTEEETQEEETQEEETTEEETEESEDSSDEAEADDLESLIARCNESDEEAQKEVTKMAIAAGMSAKDVKGAESWEEVQAFIEQQAGGETEEETEEDEEPFVPEVGKVYGYKPPKAKRVINVKVIAVNKSKETASVHKEDDKKVKFAAVPWGEFVNALE